MIPPMMFAMVRATPSRAIASNWFAMSKIPRNAVKSSDSSRHIDDHYCNRDDDDQQENQHERHRVNRQQVLPIDAFQRECGRPRPPERKQGNRGNLDNQPESPRLPTEMAFPKAHSFAARAVGFPENQQDRETREKPDKASHRDPE